MTTSNQSTFVRDTVSLVALWLLLLLWLPGIAPAQAAPRIEVVSLTGWHLMVTPKAEQVANDACDRERLSGLKVVKPAVEVIPAPLKPLRLPRIEQSVLLGRSAFMAPDNGRGGAVSPVYEPVEDGGFQITGGKRLFCRPIVHGQNRVWTSDVPIFRMDTVTGNGSYAKKERVFPLWPRPDGQVGNVYPRMGTLRLGVPRSDGTSTWLDELESVHTVYRPGYTTYEVAEPEAGWKASILVAPALDFHGMVCRVEFDRETPLVWQYGGIWWEPSEKNANEVQIHGSRATITEPNLPNGLVVAGWDGHGVGRIERADHGQHATFAATTAQRTYHIGAIWGVTSYDHQRATQTLTRLDTTAAAAWPEMRDLLKRQWFDCYIQRALEPERHFEQLMSAPSDALTRTCAWWDQRRADFQIRTPDPHLNALVNWSRCVSEYHRQGPGLILGAQVWQMYAHISVGWYGKQWGGDHEAVGQTLRFYAAMQSDDGAVRWISPSLVAFMAENNTPYWVDQVWWHYAWTHDRQFVHDMWPAVRKAVDWQRIHKDPDGDGLFQDRYEYWNCDSNGKGPKSAAPSATSWAMLDRAARLAAVVGDAQAEAEYRALADTTREQIFSQLWREDAGRLGSISVGGLWQGHPQIWEEYLAINAGLLSPDQGRRAMRWLAAHYGFEPQPGIQLLSCSDWWPIRWSTQWVPTGDTCLAALAGMKSGDPDLWWPYLSTVVRSAFCSKSPAIHMGISNAGAGGGDREDVDSDDPHAYAVVRGMFGIEPALHENRLDICPAFPSHWREASIRTPDVSYEYTREGDRATFRIHTPLPVVKRVRANLTGPQVSTPAETDSVVTVSLGPPAPPPEPNRHPTIIAERDPRPEPVPLAPEAKRRQVLFDLSDACNVTAEEMTALKFIYDHSMGHARTVEGWWHNPRLTMPTSPKVVETKTGVLFLTAGRPPTELGEPPKDRLALSSWRPYPLPAGADIHVGMPVERLWLLLQSYVHPMKNYLPNGEVVLHYKDGEPAVISLVPPLNLDCYFQYFSREGVHVPLGQLRSPAPTGFTYVPRDLADPHAIALEIPCAPQRVLDKVQLRATCSEGVLGLAGMTVLAAETH